MKLSRRAFYNYIRFYAVKSGLDIREHGSRALEPLHNSLNPINYNPNYFTI